MSANDLQSVLKQAENTPSSVDPAGTDIEALAKAHDLKRATINKLSETRAAARVNILNDLPTQADAFRITPFVRTLCDVVLSPSTQTPIAICLDGEWGTGKSSVMQMIAAQASLLGYPSIWLNAWSLESTENLLAEVAAEIRRAAEAMQSKSQLPITEFVRKSIGRLSMSFLGIGGPALKVALEVGQQNEQRAVDIEQIASVVTARQSFRDLVSSLLKNVGDEDSRLIVFVDDIDRALPDQVSNVFKNLKLILESPGCVFIMGMDMQIVAGAIESFYRGHGEAFAFTHMATGGPSVAVGKRPLAGEAVREGFGHGYLEKLIQIRMRLPRLNRDLVASYLEEMGIALEAREIVLWAPDDEILNPRRLKRYINWLSITLQLVLASGLPPDISNLFALRAMALRRDYPDAYEELLRGEEPGLSTFFAGRKSAAEDADTFLEYLAGFTRESLTAFERLLWKAPVLSSAIAWSSESFEGAPEELTDQITQS